MALKKLFTVVFILFSFIGFSQDLVYTALAAKGTCVVQRGENPDEYVPITAGVQLYLNDVVIVTGTTTYVGLVGVDGNVIEITHGGVYRLAEMHDDAIERHVFLTQKYAQALLTNNGDAVYADAVEEGVSRAASTTSTIKLQLPKKSKVFGEQVDLNWQCEQPVTNYMVAICDRFDAHVYNQTTTYNNLRIDLSLVGLLPGQSYKLLVGDADQKENVAFVNIEMLTRSELAKIETDLRILKKEVPKNSAIGDMVLASYFESNGLYLNALNYYQQAIQKEPGIVEYQKAYNQFLKRIKLI